MSEPTTDRHAIRLIAVWGAVWIALGLASLPLQAPEFRAWEHIYDSETRRFAPNQRVEMDVIGDLGFKAWVRALQHPRPTVFSTDRFGFRNPDSAEPPRIVVIGDSYVAGAGLPDSATLAVQLSNLLGERVYSFATQYLNGPALFFREERFAKVPPDVVVWSPVARAIRPRPLFVRNLGAEAEPISRLAGVGEKLRSVVRRGNEGNRLTREFRFMQQGWLYARQGHPYARELPNGEMVLALSLAEQGLLVPAAYRGAAQCVAMISELHAVFARAGVRFVFAPVPEVGSIYPELYTPAERAAIARPSFLDTVLSGLDDAGVPVVDLRPVFFAEREPYLYQRDDTHWAPRGVSIAARALAYRVRAELGDVREP